MSNIWIVARHEFLINIRQKAFLFAVFGVPALMAVIFAIIYFVNTSALEIGVTVEKMGFVDEGNVLEDVQASEQYLQYPDTDSAQVALDAGEIDAYFVVPLTYMATGNVSLFAYGSVSEDTRDEIELFLVENLVQRLDTTVPSERLIEPTNSRLFLENIQRELSETGIFGLLLVPLLFAMMMMMALQLSGQYLMAGIVEEKTNFIMEILITTVTPYQLLMGKLFGLGALGLIQLLVWIVIGGIGLAFGGSLDLLSAVVIPFDFVVVVLIYFFLSYFLFASVLSGLGTIVGSDQESRQIAGLVSLVLVVPLFFLSVLLTDPDSPLFVVFMMIPFTSGMSFMLRYPFTMIPAEQVILSISILMISTVVIVWASAKIFRWGLLLYGKKWNVLTLLNVIRGSVEMGSVPTNELKERVS